MFTLTCLGLSFPGHGPFREMKARDTVFRKAYTHVREFITNPTLWTPVSPQQSISLKPNPWDHFRQRRCRDLGERPPTPGCWGQAPATAWGSEQNSCRLRGSEAIVCLRRFSTEAPAARRKRPWGARGTRRGHGGVCGTGHPGQKALSPSRLGAGIWPVSPLVWRVEWTPVSMGPLSSKGLGFRAKGDVWEGLRKVVGRHVGEEWEGPHRTVEGPQSLRSSTS